jgi:hypothetical protein
MTTEKIYLKYLSKVEQNITNDNIATDRGRFVLLFNEAQNKFLEAHLQQRGIDDVRYIQNFLVLDKKIPYSSKTQDHYNFNLPKDYFDLAEVRGLASNKICNNQLVSLFEIQTENINEILIDEFNKPSFKWREAPYTVNSNTVSVYVDDFKVDNILMNYYRYPNQIAQINIDNPESPFNESILVEWDDKSLDRIISISAGEFDINENNPRFQLQLARQQK